MLFSTYKVEVLRALTEKFGDTVIPGCIVQFLNRPPVFSVREFSQSKANLRFWREQLKCSSIIQLIFEFAGRGLIKFPCVSNFVDTSPHTCNNKDKITILSIDKRFYDMERFKAKRYCANCGSRHIKGQGQKHHACEGCNIAYYCSKACQLNHWYMVGHFSHKDCRKRSPTENVERVRHRIRHGEFIRKYGKQETKSSDGSMYEIVD